MTDMDNVEFQSPDDLAPRRQLTPDEAAELILESNYEFWRQGGNGEGTITYPGNNTSLCIKESLRDGFLLTLLTDDDQLMPYSGDGLDDFVWDERGGDPFKVPRACLVSRATAAEIVRYYATCGGQSDIVQWISWYNLPAHYFPE
jgi:hypothetical protein